MSCLSLLLAVALICVLAARCQQTLEPAPSPIDDARSRGQVYVRRLPRAPTRSEDGDESGAAVPLRKLDLRTSPAVAHRGSPSDTAGVGGEDTEHHDRPRRR